MALDVMYAPKPNSPTTTLADGITNTQTAFDVVDGSVLPAAPNTLTIGRGPSAEVVLYATLSGNTVSDATRGFSGTTAGTWSAATSVGSYFTSYDQEAIQDNITAIDTTVTTHLEDYVSKFPDNAGAHNSIYRGKYLGDTYTAAQQAAVAAGTFEDLYIGDYWTIGGVNYRIAAFNYYYNAGDTALTDNHATIVPDSSLYNHAMNDTNTTDGGYIGSKMYTEGLDSAKSTIEAAFPGKVLTHKKYLSNAVSDGEASAGSWYDSTVELLNEVMVYGSRVNGSAVRGLFDIGVEKSQLPLFTLEPNRLNIRVSWWLRDVHSAPTFALVFISGVAYTGSASSSLGVRPAFSIS